MMKVLKWITARNFDQIDIATAITSGIFFGHDEYMASVITILVGVAISVFAEHWYQQHLTKDQK